MANEFDLEYRCEDINKKDYDSAVYIDEVNKDFIFMITKHQRKNHVKFIVLILLLIIA